jgi:hypothetical protein
VEGGSRSYGGGMSQGEASLCNEQTSGSPPWLEAGTANTYSKAKV